MSRGRKIVSLLCVQRWLLRVVVRVRMRVHNLRARGANHFCWSFAQQKYRMTNEWNKWKNHFYEMKGDVGMSLE